MITERVFRNQQNQIRAGWRILLYAVLATMCALVAMAAYEEVARFRAPEAGTGAHAGMTVGMYFSLLVGILFPAFFMLRFADKRPSSVLGFARHDRVWIEAGQGVLQGACMVTAIFAVEWLAGYAKVSWSGLQPLVACRLAGHYVIFFTFAAAFEEALLRGYAFQALVQGTGKIGAVCVSSFAFGLAHLANPNVNAFAIVNAMLAGVWLSAAYLKTRSLWLPTSLHMSWNLAQGFIYGFPISGMPLPVSLMNLIQHGHGLMTGGAYGPEGGVLSSAVLILSTVYMVQSKRVRPGENAMALWHFPDAVKEEVTHKTGLFAGG